MERTLLVMVLIGGRLCKVVKGTVMDSRPLPRPSLWIREEPGPRQIHPMLCFLFSSSFSIFSLTKGPLPEQVRWSE
jgi:hypothetical protein